MLPLKVTRHIDALGSKSSFSTVVVSEKIDFDAGSGEFSSAQDNQYVMNRRSIENVQNDEAYTFAPENVVDRSPAYRINFPLDTKAKDYLIYKNEIGATYTASPDPVHPSSMSTVCTSSRSRRPRPPPITPAYLQLLSKTVPLPRR